MKKLCCLIMMFVTCRICEGQNLVPNGDFEQYSGCPDAYAQFDSLLFWFNPGTWPGNGGTPDYFNVCATSWVGVPDNFTGYQQPHSGAGYGGFFCYYDPAVHTDYREYIEVPLASTLTANACYDFSMYINLANMSKYATDDISAYFSDTIVDGINGYLLLPFIPQINNTTGIITDTLNWTLITGSYTASGSENFLIIGNFKSDINTTAILIKPCCEAAFFLIDDVSLIPCTTGINDVNEYPEINISPNPFSATLNITTNVSEYSEIILYDITSRKLLQQKFISSVSLNTEQLAKGIYLYELRNPGSYGNRVIKKGKVIKD